MPLPTFEKAEDVPEAVRGGYIEREGKWVPDDSDVAGLKASQRTLLAEKKAAAEERDRLKAVIGDRKPEDVAELLRQHQETEEERQKKAGDFEKITAKRVAEALDPVVKENQSLKERAQELNDLKLDIAIRDACAKAKVTPEDVEDVAALVKAKGRIKLDEKTGKPVVYDADGDPTGMTVEKFFAETFKAEKPRYYQPAGGSGGGSNGGNPIRKGGDGAIVLTAEEGRDVQKYRAARAEAEKLKVPFRIEG